jgi:hypothetical protein
LVAVRKGQDRSAPRSGRNSSIARQGRLRRTARHRDVLTVLFAGLCVGL